jgi:hypothetical protein
LLRAASPAGPWNPVNATFVPVSDDTILAEVAFATNSPQFFYRVMMTGETGSTRVVAAEKSGAKFRLRFQWAR